eukprot:Plantae.Rhodophyta-Hildenbrandia_rubra.ctg2078.p1 GENE.Plantae.Rhodophyta-Hildenbrandia_rubra.ctg2078~~Plantae.Rhodophyta-Hildenbrandia_rubra.ctg2078.p1  ORF type:complete len:1120 (-),score=225.88 Plantae.Rhodophyta-Hildenbrandia_rubra.ctg2078:1264-4623(-)
MRKEKEKGFVQKTQNEVLEQEARQFREKQKAKRLEQQKKMVELRKRQDGTRVGQQPQQRQQQQQQQNNSPRFLPRVGQNQSPRVNAAPQRNTQYQQQQTTSASPRAIKPGPQQASTYMHTQQMQRMPAPTSSPPPHAKPATPPRPAISPPLQKASGGPPMRSAAAFNPQSLRATKPLRPATSQPAMSQPATSLPAQVPTRPSSSPFEQMMRSASAPTPVATSMSPVAQLPRHLLNQIDTDFGLNQSYSMPQTVSPPAQIPVTTRAPPSASNGLLPSGAATRRIIREPSALLQKNASPVTTPASRSAPASTAHQKVLPMTPGPMTPLPMTPAPVTPQPMTPTRQMPQVTQHIRTTTNPQQTSVNHIQRRLPNGQAPIKAKLGDFPDIKDAILSLRTDRPALGALAKVCKGKYVRGAAEQRKVILEFAGFRPQIVSKSSIAADINCLTNLTRVELDTIGWAFGLARKGRKLDTATKIIEYLMHPTEKVVSRCRPMGVWPSARPLNAEPAQSSVLARNGWQQGLANGQRVPVRNVPTRPHTSMPPLPARANNRAMTPVKNTQARTPYDTLLPGGKLRIGASKKQYPRTLTLPEFDFMVSENPFNVPVNKPLGSPMYALFNSGALDRGREPSLSFATPQTRKAEGGSRIQVQLRCLRVEKGKTPAEWKQFWPFPCYARVNGNYVGLKQAQRFTNGKLAGIDMATNISPHLNSNRRQAIPNKVILKRTMTSSTSTSGSFVLFAQEVLVKSSADMVKEVVDRSRGYWEQVGQRQQRNPLNSNANKSLQGFDVAKQEVASFMTAGGMEIENMKVSLRCPLSLTRIDCPVKGKNCSHVQCFDLKTFLEFSRKSSKFECPVCNKKTASPDVLVVHPYIERALELFKENDEILVLTDASMTGVEPQAPSGVASDDSDDSDEEGNSTPRDVKKQGKRTGDKTPSSRKTASFDVVDLTLDSSDDEAPAPASAPAPGPATPQEYRQYRQYGRQEPNVQGSTGLAGSSFDQANMRFDGLSDFAASQPMMMDMQGGSQNTPFRTDSLDNALDSILSTGQGTTGYAISQRAQTQSIQPTAPAPPLQSANNQVSFGLEDLGPRNPMNSQESSPFPDNDMNGLIQNPWTEVISIDSD